MQLAAWMMVSGGYEKEIPYAYERVKSTIDKHLALDKMAMWVESQGGNKESVYEGTGLKKASRQKKVYAEEDGFLYCVDATEVGKAALILGAGRVQKEDKIDLGAGIELLAQDGEWVEKGKAFAILHYEEEEKALQAEKILKKAYEIKNAKMDSKALIKKVIAIKEC